MVTAHRVRKSLTFPIIRIVMKTSLHLIPLDAESLNRTPPEVIDLILSFLERIRVLEARVEELEAKLNRTSSNSNKPPSSDSPFSKQSEVASKAKKLRKRKVGVCHIAPHFPHRPRAKYV